MSEAKLKNVYCLVALKRNEEGYLKDTNKLCLMLRKYDYEKSLFVDLSKKI